MWAPSARDPEAQGLHHAGCRDGDGLIKSHAMLPSDAAPDARPPTLLRSVLYMPGSNARALAKAATLPADAFIFDLEDAVAPEAKPDARRQVAEALAALPRDDRRRIVRVNGADTPWGGADLETIAGLTQGLVDAVLLPKVESATTVERARAVLPPGLDIACMIETPRGVLAAEAIAAAPGVSMLVVGTSDLSKDLRVRPHPERLPLLFSLSRVVLVARAHGLAALDGPCLDLTTPGVFEREAGQGVSLGFDGKTLIHPSTIDSANRLFAPTPDEITAAQRVVDAFTAAATRGSGVVVVDGRLVEALHVQAARDRLALAAAIARSGRTGEA